MSDGWLRLRYSGFILFTSRIFSIGTGLIFTLMVTRSTSVEEFGIFNNLTDILFYFTVAAGIIPFWTTRFVARRHPCSSKTGLTTNLIFSSLFFTVYLSLIPMILHVFQIDEKYLLVYTITAIRIMEVYMLYALEAILQPTRPQMLGFGFSIFEITKIALGFILIMQFNLGLIGIVASIISASFLQFLFYLKLTSHEFHEKIRWNYVKEWLKASPLNFYGMLSERLLAFTNIFLFVYGGELSRAYYGAAWTIAGIIGYSSLLAYALYPRLLSGSRSEDVPTSFKMVLMFALPMTLGAMVLSDSFLTILNPSYRVARLVLILLSLYSLCITFSSIFDSIVGGTEKLDAEARISYRGIVRSRLFLSLTLPYIQAAVVVPLTYFVLISMVRGAVEAATSLALINTVANIVVNIAKYRIAKRCLDFGMPWGHIGKYLGASALMALVLYFLPTPTRILTTLAITFLGISVYFLVLSAIDKESRNLARSAMRELQRIFKISSVKGA